MLRALLLLFLVLHSGYSSDCDNSFDDSDEGLCYEIAEAKNWADAQSLCHNLGAEVASVHSQQENSFIRRLAASSGILNGVLLGGGSSGKGNTFVWIDGTTWDYDNFRSGYPKVGLGDCMFMDTSTTAGQWMNTDCDRPMPAVCARPRVAPAPTSGTTKKSSIPDPEPIKKDDPRYDAYKDVADLLGSWMNTSINPCDDFYAFTCGAGKPNQGMSFDLADNTNTNNMLKILREPANYFANSPLPVRQLKWFYDACLTGTTESDQAARSKRIFNNLRSANPGVGFPALYPKETTAATPEQLGAFLGYEIGTDGVATLISVGVDTDWKDPHNSGGGYALFVDQPAVMFESKFYTKMYYGNKDEVVDGILNTINAAAKLLGITNVDQKQARKDAEDVAQFDFDLAMKYSTDDTTRQTSGLERMYNPYDVDGLQKLAPFVNWKTLINKALAPISKTVDGSFRVINSEVDKLSFLSNDITFGNIPSRTINNYLYLRALSAHYLPQVFSTTSKKSSPLNEWRREASDNKRRHSRKLASTMTKDFSYKEANCANAGTQWLGYAGSRVFVGGNYDSPKDLETIRDQTNTFLRSLVAAFRAQIDLLDWMTPAAKKGAYQKLDNLVVNNAFPDWVLDNTKLESYYKKLSTTQKDSYLDQLDKLGAFERYETFVPLINGLPADRTEFSGPADMANAWYQPQLNSLTIPGGIEQHPFYDVDYPAAVNYGGLGVIAGNELTRAVNGDGMQWDGTGILTSWTDENTTKGYVKMAKCVKDEYDSFCPLGTGLPCIDGTQTLTENIGDNGGIQTAYKAFKSFEALNGPDPLLPGDASVYNADQLFFLSFAQVWCQYPPSSMDLLMQIILDPHAPSQYRVLGTLQNFPAFKKAFNCPAGSTYAPHKHCDVWTSEPTSGAPKDNDGLPIVPDNEVNIAPVERVSSRNLDKYYAYQTALTTLKASGNITVDPCNDFYHYSCGNYPGATTTSKDLQRAIPVVINDKLNDPKYQATIQSSQALTKLKTLYNSCKAESTHSTIETTNYIQPKVLAFRNNINQDIPLIGGTGEADMTPENYGNTLGYLSFELGIDTLVTPLVDTNWMDPQATRAGTTNGYQLFLDQATTFHARAFYDGDNWAKQKPAYLNQVKTLIEAYAKQDKTAELPGGYDQMIDDALELERTIAITYSGTDDERRHYQRQWNPLKKNNLPPTVDWDKYFSSAPRDAQDWYNTKDIVVNELDYTSKMFNFLGNKDDSTVINYLFIRLLLANSGLIPCSNGGQCSTVKKQLAMKRKSDGADARSVGRHPIPSFAAFDDDDVYGVGCADALSVLPDAQGRVYIDARFPTQNDRDTIRQKTLGVMTNIVDAMKAMILQLDWMSQDSKNNALNKASNMQVNIAFPDYILNNAALDAQYASLTLLDGDSYYAMLDKITLYSIGQRFAILKASRADRTDFRGQTTAVDASYTPELNAITIPSGILQAPFCDANYPAGLNYGGIGTVLGRELTHGFDDEGVQWDFDGRLNSWMDKGSQDGFNSMAQCVIDEYGRFCPLPEGYSPRCTDGTRTQGENIADNGGIHAAWRAYQAHLELNGPDPLFRDRLYSQFTENELFFLNFAQSHCTQRWYLSESYVSGRLMTDSKALEPYRVLGTLQNIPAFQVNFNCPKGSTYAPQQHCNVWVPTKMA